MKKRFEVQQMIEVLREAQSGVSVKDVIKKYNISDATYYKWKKKFGGMCESEARRLKELEKENARLKRLVAEQALLIQAQKEVLEKKMVSPPRKRLAAKQLLNSGIYSERLACRAVGLYRSTFYYQAKAVPEEEKRIIGRVLELSNQYPNYGQWKIRKLLYKDGWQLGKTRMHRLWQQQSLQVRPKHHKRRRLRSLEPRRREALYPNHVWSWDFQFDRLADGRQVKLFHLIDEKSRVSLIQQPGLNFTSQGVIQCLKRAIFCYGIPGFIRSDNGPEFIAAKVQKWLEDSGIAIDYIQPGSPWENGYIESFNGRFREECLNRELFLSMTEMQVIVQQWRDEYNQHRPHGSLQFETPATIWEQWMQRPLEQQNAASADSLRSPALAHTTQGILT